MHVAIERSLSLFARAIVNAIRGGACSTESETVAVGDVFRFIRRQFKAELARINAANQAGFINPDDELGATPLLEMRQTPLLFLPPGKPQMIRNPICFRCGPPAAPERPYVRTFIFNSTLCIHCSLETHVDNVIL